MHGGGYSPGHPGGYPQGSHLSSGQMYTQQPGMGMRRGMRAVPAFMPAPEIIPGVPLGLEYLAMVDGIIVNQLVEILEVMFGIETRNQYSLCNAVGQQVYFAFEESSFAARQLAGKDRPFTMFITDNMQRPVIRVHRPYTCCAGSSCCCYYGCCKDECIVECPPGQVIGRIVQKGSCCSLSFYVHDMAGQPMFLIVGPSCICGCEDQEYKIFTAAGMAQIGAITKKWGGLAKEMYTDADTFFVRFPIDLDVHLKAVLIGAPFLIDFMAYEDNAGAK